MTGSRFQLPFLENLPPGRRPIRYGWTWRRTGPAKCTASAGSQLQE